MTLEVPPSASGQWSHHLTSEEKYRVSLPGPQHVCNNNSIQCIFVLLMGWSHLNVMIVIFTATQSYKQHLQSTESVSAEQYNVHISTDNIHTLFIFLYYVNNLSPMQHHLLDSSLKEMFVPCFQKQTKYFIGATNMRAGSSVSVMSCMI